MPKNKGKGGKNRRRGKNENEGLKRELVFKEDGQEYAQVEYDYNKAYLQKVKKLYNYNYNVGSISVKLAAKSRNIACENQKIEKRHILSMCCINCQYTNTAICMNNPSPLFSNRSINCSSGDKDAWQREAGGHVLRRLQASLPHQVKVTSTKYFPLLYLSVRNYDTERLLYWICGASL